MTATSLPSAAPPHAIRCWVDPKSIYFELSGVNGPAIIAFPRSSSGLATAIATLFAVPEAGIPYSRPQLANSLPDKNGITARQRNDARDILARMKII